MTEIRRYEMVTKYRGHHSWDELEKDPEGSWVRHEDLAANVAGLQEQVQKLAAENVAVKSYLNGGGKDVELSMDETDAIIREIGAKAFEELAAGQRGLAEVRTRQFKAQAAQKAISIAEMLEREAARLRAGEQP